MDKIGGIPVGWLDSQLPYKPEHSSVFSFLLFFDDESFKTKNFLLSGAHLLSWLLPPVIFAKDL
ncbi:TPA: hypothetical protein HA242_07450 [Candidatus Woesearchaeota archaeon]|nr:hypothetical protein [Candidatus Woesearchaeota archaeon]HIH13532.1 hypothetical protein [Candidatus Woesearchaeota archaeon]